MSTRKNIISEGLLDFIINLIQASSVPAFNSAQIDNSKLVKIEKDLKPKESLEDQITAAVCVSQCVGYGVEELLFYLERAPEKLIEIEESSKEDLEDWTSLASTVFKELSEASGRLRQWLLDTPRCSKKVFSIGENLDAGEKTSVTLSNTRATLESLEGLNLVRELEKVMNADGAEAYFEKFPSNEQYLKDTIPQVEKVSVAIVLLDEIIPQIEALEQLLEVAIEGDEIKQDPVKSDVLESTLYKRTLLRILNECR